VVCAGAEGAGGTEGVAAGALVEVGVVFSV
jgi:hypothetical protein